MVDEVPPDAVDDGAVLTAEEAQRIAPELGAEPELVRDHLAQLPSRYPAAVSPRAVIRHALMASSRPQATEVRTRVTAGEGEPDGVAGIDELDVVAIDHTGWFSKVAGVVTMHRGGIVAADAFTRSDGIAIETFKIQGPFEAPRSWWARIEGDLDEAAAGRLAVRARVMREVRAQSARLRRGPEAETTIAASPDPSGRSTILDVRTPDRRGVLYTIAEALAELQIDIIVARVQSVDDDAHDVFTIRNAQGRPLDEHHLAEVELGVRAGLESLWL